MSVTLSVLLCGISGGVIVALLRIALPQYVMRREFIEQRLDRNLFPHECLVGFAYQVLGAARIFAATAGRAGSESTNGAVAARDTNSLRISALATAFVSLGIAIVAFRAPLAWPLSTLVCMAGLGLFLIAMNSFEWRLIPDVVVAVVGLSGITAAVIASGEAPAQALVGAATGFGLAWLARAFAGLVCWEPIGYAVPKLCFSVGVWIGPRDIVIALSLSLAASGVAALVRRWKTAEANNVMPLGGFLAVIGGAMLLYGAA